jgi:hypothetical protein
VEQDVADQIRGDHPASDTDVPPRRIRDSVQRRRLGL